MCIRDSGRPALVRCLGLPARARVGGSHWQQQCRGPTRSGFRRTSVILNSASRSALSRFPLFFFDISVLMELLLGLAWSVRLRASGPRISEFVLRLFAKPLLGSGRCTFTARDRCLLLPFLVSVGHDAPARGTARRPARQRLSTANTGPAVGEPRAPPGGRVATATRDANRDVRPTRLLRAAYRLRADVRGVGAAGARRRQPADGLLATTVRVGQPAARLLAALRRRVAALLREAPAAVPLLRRLRVAALLADVVAAALAAAARALLRDGAAPIARRATAAADQKAEPLYNNVQAGPERLPLQRDGCKYPCDAGRRRPALPGRARAPVGAVAAVEARRAGLAQPPRAQAGLRVVGRRRLLPLPRAQGRGHVALQISLTQSV